MAAMGSRHRGSEEEVLALNAFIKLERAAESVATRVHAHLAMENLTVSQFGVLECVFHLGPLCQRDIGQKLLKSGGNITMVVNNLEKRGLVRRERSSENRKFVSVDLTEEGRSVIRRVFPRHVAAVLKEVGVLPAPDQVVLARLCKAVGRPTGSDPSSR